MAQPKFNKDDVFFKTPAETVIDVVAFRGNVIMVREMTFKSFVFMKRHKGWTYSSFQKGFCSIQENKNEAI